MNRKRKKYRVDWKLVAWLTVFPVLCGVVAGVAAFVIFQIIDL